MFARSTVKGNTRASESGTGNSMALTLFLFNSLLPGRGRQELLQNMKQSVFKLLRVLSVICAIVTPLTSEALRIDNTHYRFCVMDDGTITDYATLSAYNSNQLPSFASARWSAYNGVELKTHVNNLTSNYTTDVPVLMTRTYSGSDCSIYHRWTKGYNGVGYDQTTYFYITVDAPSDITLTDAPSKMLVGEKETLKKKLEGSYTSFSGNGYFAYEYSSSASDVVSVSQGTITAKQVGKAIITVKAYAKNRKYDGSYYIGSASVEIEVVDNMDPVDITLSQLEMAIDVGEEKTISASLTPEDARTTITWLTSNQEIATVQDGKIKGIGRGTAIIEARTANGLSAKCYVTVLGEEDYKHVLIDELYYDIDRHSKTATVVPKLPGKENSSYVTGKVIIPERISFYNNDYTVNTIGKQAFYKCSISTADIPASVTRICGSAFSETMLDEIELPDNLTEIGEMAFAGSRIESIIIGPKITQIGNGAFSNCEQLQAIYIDNGNAHFTIYENCLYNTTKTILFYIPVNSLSVKLYDGLKTINGYACPGNTYIQNIVFPEQLTNIGEGAFQNCCNLSSIILPETIIGIEQNAFRGCTTLTSIVVEALRPPFVAENSFDNYNAVLVVPKGRVTTYQKHEIWGKFKKITDEKQNGIDTILTDHDLKDGYTIFNISGILIKSNATQTEWNSLPAGIYIVNGKKVEKK